MKMNHTQHGTSGSQQSKANVTRSFSPLSHRNSKPFEHQRGLLSFTAAISPVQALAFRDRTGPFDLALTRDLLPLCQQYDIPHACNTFKYYRSGSAAAWDIRAALACFALDSSHGWEGIHMDFLVVLAMLVRCYIESDLVQLLGQ